MIIDKQLCILAAKAALNVYQHNTNYGKGVEAALTMVKHRNKNVLILAFAGTNDKLTINPKTWVTPWWDWIRNVDIRVEDGVKRSSMVAARRMRRYLSLSNTIDVVATGHSLGGSRAIAYGERYPCSAVIPWNPPPTISKGRQIKRNNMILFRDPDDPVDTAGHTWFEHPICKTVSRKDNCIGKRVSEHDMALWLPYLDEMDDFRI